MAYAILLISPGRWLQAKTQQPIGVVSLVIIHVNDFILSSMVVPVLSPYYLSVSGWIVYRVMYVFDKIMDKKKLLQDLVDEQSERITLSTSKGMVASGMSCLSTWTLRSAKTQILFSFGWIIRRSCQSCIQWLAKLYVCRHLQLPVREYLVLLVVFWRSAEQTCHQELWTVFCSCIATWNKDTGQYCGWWWCCSGAAWDLFLCLWAV